jgi:hypothetical protein
MLMPDRERVIFDIERCICHVPDACRDCSKYGEDNALRCMENLLEDALELLKEQEKQIENLEYSLAITESNIRHYINGND